jgi:hypothetical protein
LSRSLFTAVSATFLISTLIWKGWNRPRLYSTDDNFRRLMVC